MIVTVDGEVLIFGFACVALIILGIALIKALKEIKDDK